ncbi:MAG: hypothetical protein RL198_216 [Actinomycetota bacterium]
MPSSTATIKLRGMTWDHARAIDGLIACDGVLAERFGVEIEWERRSLLAFGDQHIAEFAGQFDLMVIDHPHVPDAVQANAVLALEPLLGADRIAELARESVGESHNSYLYKGQVWALAVDTAAQVSANRRGAKLRVPPFWDQVLRDAASGRVLWPYKPVDAFSTFATLLAQLGKPLARRDEPLNSESAREALDLMIALAKLVPDWCSEANPIDVAEALSEAENFDYAVALFGYTNYSRVGFRPHLLEYEDIPSFDGRATGSELGGAGIAVSSATKHPEVCGQVASYLAGAEAQAGLYGLGGGQPGNLVAWLDPELNSATNQFFRHTLRTLERAWVRPRVLGWPDYQLALSHIVHRVLVDRAYTAADIAEMQALPELHLLEVLP